MSRRKSVTFEECFANIQTYIRKPENLALIEKAWQFAHKHHEGQFRKSGEPYEIHVIQVAYILSTLHSSPTTIVAGLLHDTVEDCEEVTTDIIREEFGQDVAAIVEAVTKIGAIKFKDEK